MFAQGYSSLRMPLTSPYQRSEATAEATVPCPNVRSLVEGVLLVMAEKDRDWPVMLLELLRWDPGALTPSV